MISPRRCVSSLVRFRNAGYTGTVKATPTLPLVALVCLLLAPALAGQDAGSASATEGAPPPPESHILDDTGFFRDHPTELATLSDSLKRIQAKHGYPVYLVIYYSVIEENLQAKADELHRAWFGEQGNGMVLVYQRDPVAEGDNPAIAFYQGSDLEEKTDASRLPDNLVPRRDMEALLANVFRDLKPSPEEPMSYVTGIVSGIERELDAYFKVEPPKWNDTPNLRLMAVFAGAVAGLGLLGMLFWRVLSRAETKSALVYYFPDVKTGRRLGAPYGGGWASERTFAASSSRE